MKKTKITTIVLLIVVVATCFVLTGCDAFGHKYSSVYQQSESQHWQVCVYCGESTEKVEHTFGEWKTIIDATETESGLHYRKCEICGYQYDEAIPPTGGGQQQNPPVDVQATGTVDFYAINDFHGEHNKLSQISGYINAQINNTNTVAINSGDMFQGSMESNWNYGSLFTECMDIAGFDAFTYGNHEFDWGLDNLRSLSANSLTPFLGANIYNWNADTKTWGDFAEDLAQEYVVKELDNGLKVGIIGVIGKDQITSISSQLVQTIGFKDPKEVVPDLSNKLRDTLDCDIVVVSAHTGPETFLDDKSWDITQYADAVFCAHTHKSEDYVKNGVPFIQGGAYGNYVSHVTLSVDNHGNVSCSKYENISYYGLYDINATVKNQVQTKINNSNKQIADEAKEVLATLSDGYLNSATAIPRLVANAIADYAVEQGYEIDLAMVNNARSSLQAGPITYTALYEAIPFDNVVYIAKVSGADLLNEAGYSSNSIWRVSGKAIQNSRNVYYTIAVIDYLLYHQNSSRNYNYFSSAFSSGFTPIPLTKPGIDMYNYRLITRDFLRAQGTVSALPYLNVNDHTNVDKLTQTVKF